MKIKEEKRENQEPGAERWIGFREIASKWAWERFSTFSLSSFSSFLSSSPPTIFHKIPATILSQPYQGLQNLLWTQIDTDVCEND